MLRFPFRKREADIVFKLQPKCKRSLINTLSRKPNVSREHQDPRHSGTANGASCGKLLIGFGGLGTCSTLLDIGEGAGSCSMIRRLLRLVASIPRYPKYSA
jgi:hypothetical protein